MYCCGQVKRSSSANPKLRPVMCLLVAVLSFDTEVKQPRPG